MSYEDGMFGNTRTILVIRVQYIFSYMHTMYLLVQLSVELTEIFSHCFFREINAFLGKKYIESWVHEIFLREQKIP